MTVWHLRLSSCRLYSLCLHSARTVRVHSVPCAQLQLLCLQSEKHSILSTYFCHRDFDTSQPVGQMQFSARFAKHVKDRDISHLTREQLFILRVLEYRQHFGVSDKNLKTYEQRLSLLVGRGCRIYELIECYNVLFLDEYEIVTRIERLHSLGVDTISMPLVVIASPSWQTEALRVYLKKKGCVSSTGVLTSALQCTDNELIEILARNPRLAGRRSLQDIAAKIECLTSHGASLEDIKAESFVLSSKSLTTLRVRATQLDKLGYNCPLPLSLILRPEKDYRNIVNNLQTQHGSSTATAANFVIKHLCGKVTGKFLVMNRDKVEYLLSKGYQPEHILSYPEILQLSQQKLKSAVNDLLEHHIGLVALPICHSYAKDGSASVRRRRLRFQIASILNIDAASLPKLPVGMAMLVLDKLVISNNLRFLTDRGYTVGEISQLPVVLTHSPENLQSHFNAFSDGNTDGQIAAAFNMLGGSFKVRQLNILQYSIERATNFCSASVHSGEDRLPDDMGCMSEQQSPGNRCHTQISAILPVPRFGDSHEHAAVLQQ